MSDFDAALERLLTDPSFAAQLAADPDRALAGYRLDAGESEVLRSQVDSDSRRRRGEGRDPDDEIQHVRDLLVAR